MLARRLLARATNAVALSLRSSVTRDGQFFATLRAIVRHSARGRLVVTQALLQSESAEKHKAGQLRRFRVRTIGHVVGFREVGERALESLLLTRRRRGRAFDSAYMWGFMSEGRRRRSTTGGWLPWS